MVDPKRHGHFLRNLILGEGKVTSQGVVVGGGAGSSHFRTLKRNMGKSGESETLFVLLPIENLLNKSSLFVFYY